ncbi:MAG: hypothetical protein AAF191_19340, partial [Verrucomicrobiota bacterium]
MNETPAELPLFEDEKDLGDAAARAKAPAPKEEHRGSQEEEGRPPRKSTRSRSPRKSGRNRDRKPRNQRSRRSSDGEEEGTEGDLQAGDERGHGKKRRERKPRVREAPSGPPFEGSGLLEVSSKGFGFLRQPDSNFNQAPNDIFVTPEMVRGYGLRDGMWLQGEAREGVRGPQLCEL